jgi:hypothetical protein
MVVCGEGWPAGERRRSAAASEWKDLEEARLPCVHTEHCTGGLLVQVTSHHNLQTTAAQQRQGIPKEKGKKKEPPAESAQRLSSTGAHKGQEKRSEGEDAATATRAGDTLLHARCWFGHPPCRFLSVASVR